VNGADKRTKYLVGKYASFVLTEKVRDPVDAEVDISDIGRNLALHVVGMNPKSVGLLEDLESSENTSSCSSSESESESSEEGSDSGVMLEQPYVLNESVRVADVIQIAGINIVDFARFECGEVLPGKNEE
jgi:elongation factor Ts